MQDVSPTERALEGFTRPEMSAACLNLLANIYRVFLYLHACMTATIFVLCPRRHGSGHDC